jgi:hypothetical protein
MLGLAEITNGAFLLSKELELLEKEWWGWEWGLESMGKQWEQKWWGWEWELELLEKQWGQE